MHYFPRIGRNYKKAAEVSKEKPISGLGVICFPARKRSFSSHSCLIIRLDAKFESPYTFRFVAKEELCWSDSVKKC